MSMDETEALASLRILVKVAQSDGTIHEEERRALSTALADLKLPGPLESLLSEDVDLDSQVSLLKSASARDEAYKSAYAMAYADGSCSPEEEKVLVDLAEKLHVSTEERGVLGRLFEEGKDTVLPSHIKAISDPITRDKEISQDILKYSVLSAALGAFPIPGLAIATDLGVIGLQVKMIRDIGQYWGHTVDKKGARSMLYGLGLGTGARLAVNNLAKLFPGWGSAVGAATSFAATYGLGRVMNKYFSDGAKGDVSTLKSDFSLAEKEGKAAYKENKEKVDEAGTRSREKVHSLSSDLKDGKVTKEEYEKQLSEL